jgi:hypothetical protein
MWLWVGASSDTLLSEGENVGVPHPCGFQGCGFSVPLLDSLYRSIPISSVARRSWLRMRKNRTLENRKGAAPTTHIHIPLRLGDPNRQVSSLGSNPIAALRLLPIVRAHQVWEHPIRVHSLPRA